MTNQDVQDIVALATSPQVNDTGIVIEDHHDDVKVRLTAMVQLLGEIALRMPEPRVKWRPENERGNDDIRG